ncbi:hypothetical protein LMG29542_08536 [Paraburkholderia humisilvae]|uniref:Uncharacterized protein n=1 Tax=Paraburkholderia humisilvae TaxID=627669 RepID=A0A6J5F9I7_9BURK|nr:hypothetical protein LMG29542_08536 [Paraburkholderia humisilvae]
MTTVERLKRYTPRTILETHWHGAKAVKRSSKEAIEAGRLLLAGKVRAEVALAVGVARQTMYTWKRLLDEGGIDARLRRISAVK